MQASTGQHGAARGSTRHGMHSLIKKKYERATPHVFSRGRMHDAISRQVTCRLGRWHAPLRGVQRRNCGFAASVFISIV